LRAVGIGVIFFMSLCNKNLKLPNWFLNLLTINLDYVILALYHKIKQCFIERDNKRRAFLATRRKDVRNV
jgi:hypothetical protein